MRNNINSSENKWLLFWLFVAICGPIIQGLFRSIHMYAISTAASYIDEIFVIILLIYTMISKSFHKAKPLLLAIVSLYVVGLISGANSKFTWVTNSLGAFNNLKSFIVCLCFCQYTFSKKDFLNFGKKFIYFFPVIVLSYIVEFCIPSFRSAVLDFGNQGVSYRMGLRLLGGIFPTYTYASLWGLVMYILYTVYFPFGRVIRFKRMFSAFMIFATIKVKDVVAFCLTNAILFSKKLKPYYILVFGIFAVMLFELYQFLLPEHYNIYFGEDSDDAIRNIMNVTSVKIADDFFPLGVGWGKFGSATSAQIYSEVYNNYGIEGLWGLNYETNHSFMQDNQLPMFLGETGYLGTLLFFFILYYVFKPFIIGFFKNTRDFRFAMPASLFIYFLVCIIGKPVFVAVPHSFVIWGVAGIFYSISKHNNNAL